MKSITTLIAAAWASFASPALAEPMTCLWASKQQCDPSASCRSVKNEMWATADVPAKLYRRCDAKGCDSYTAEVFRAGAYTTFNLIGRGVFLKLGPDNAATEVVSLGNSVLVSQGTCRPTAAR